MPPRPGFADNPLVTRQDVIRAAKALIAPIEQHRSALGARVKVRPASVAVFDDVAAQLEGFARPLLAVGAILDDDSTLDRWCRGLEAGVDVAGPEYWGDIGDFDQRMVETESICVALLAAPEAIMPRMSDKGRIRLVRWLRQINERAMPPNNWRWFRIFVNLALTKVLGVPRQEVEDVVQADFAVLDSFRIGQGWSSDGKWGDDRKQADYYSGSFAIQFSQLLYVRFADGDEERVEGYKQQAGEFAAEYWRYFDVDGAAIPFGRSMTYRFAFAAFWAAAAVAGVNLPAPVNNPGTVKGLLLRHLRWWTRHEDMFNSDGILNIGFAYPNMHLSEAYNSPQSVYWCLKSLTMLINPEDHAFWQCEELPHPLTQKQGLEACRAIWPPRHIIDSSPEHHYMLSSGQMTTKPHRAKDAKYCKFAYSSTFGFSVPAGLTLEQIAPDSTLCVSIDGGETWKVRGGGSAADDVRLERVAIGEDGEQYVQGLTSDWRPWKGMLDLDVETTLVPLAQHWRGWHVRIHRVRWSGAAEAALLAGTIQFIDGGFAIPSSTAASYHVPEAASADELATREEGGWYRDSASALIRSQAGAGGISILGPEFASASQTSEAVAFVLQADPNTNLISPRTFIACVRYHVAAASGRTDASGREAWLVSGVFAVSGSRVSAEEVGRLWKRRPVVVRVGAAEGDDDEVRFKVVGD